jgi:hypothetical protein
VNEQRRYAEDPDPRWYSGRPPYEPGVPESRRDDELGIPEQRSGDEPRYPLLGSVEPADSYSPGDQFGSGAHPETYRSAGGLVSGDRSSGTFGLGPAADPSITTGGFGHGRGPTDEDPMKAPAVLSALDAIRVPLPATVYPPVRPSSADPAAAAGSAGGPDPGAAGPMGSVYNAPTSFVPPLGVRTVGGSSPSPSPSAEPAGSGRSTGNGVYRTRRPVSAIVFAVVTAVLMIPVLRLLIAGAVADRPSAAGTVPAVLLTLGLPLTGAGLYAVASAGRPIERTAWLRPPVGYLAVGLVLLIAAALATA